MTSRRDLSKAARRDAILDATVALLGARDSAEVTTEEIAALAGVAPATVYNLIGTRDDVLRSLVARILEKLAISLGALDPSDPIAAARLVVDQTVDAFVADSAAFRRIIRLAPRASPDGATLVDPSNFQVTAMQRAQQKGIIRDDIDAAGLGRQIYLSYTGAMNLWSADRLDDEGFSIAARHGLISALAAAATEPHRARFVGEMRELGAQLEADAWIHSTH